jgi:pimeloyl-ACP methyl ester carboxylesterase
VIRPVFIHGAGCTADVWRAQLDAFADGYAVRLPGHGESGEPASIAAFADAVAAALDRSAIDEAVLCGSSMGGAIALELALRNDPRIRGLMLLGSGARLRVAPAILAEIASDFDAATRRIPPAFFAQATPERVDAAIAMMHAVGAAQTLRDFEACNAFDVVERLPEIAVPLLAVTGDADVMTPPKFAQLLADRVQRGQARILPGTGHLVMIERPSETNDAIRAFVDSVAHP